MNAMTTIRTRARMLGAEEELELYRRHMDGDGRATRVLIEAHMPLINKIAGRYSRFGDKHEDIVQEGVVGFLQGLDHFDPTRGFRLNTLCRWWIKAAITEWVRTNHSLVRIGTTAGQKKLFGSLREAMIRLSIYPDNFLSQSDLAALEADLKMPAAEIEEMAVRLAANAETSLDVKMADDAGSSTRVEQMADERHDVESLEQRIDDDRRRQALRRALDTLDPRKRDIVVRRYLNDEVETLEDLSLTYGVSRERIRQLEVQAISELGLSVPAGLSQFAGQERRSLASV